MKPSVIVWDLETVPDLAGLAAANDLVGKSDADIREVIGNRFPKHIYHTIICIGALVAHREGDHWAVDALGAPHVGERTKQLISSFCDKIAELKPQLVTFNGNSFDLPVLRFRAMIHGVSAPGLAARLYFNQYTEDAGCFHSYVRTSRTFQPFREFKQSVRRCGKSTHLTLHLSMRDNTKAGHHLRLVHVDTRAPLVQRLHRHLLKVRPALRIGMDETS